jgi:hypothetical protein
MYVQAHALHPVFITRIIGKILLRDKLITAISLFYILFGSDAKHSSLYLFCACWSITSGKGYQHATFQL